VLASLKVNRRLAVAAGVVVVALLVAGLLAAGVFSSGGTDRVTTSTTTPGTTTTQTSTHPVAPAAIPAPATTLKPGDQGAQVKVLQRALARLGYSSGAVDGDYGPATQTALKRFQTASGQAADGVLGPKTLAALKQALLAHG
jgi:peptidoglycan hydrolase-like protein with peptidoglycan-binding domain